MQQEIWKDAPGFEAFYEVSSLGNIRNKKKGRMRKFDISGQGYYRVTLRKGYDRHRVTVHRLIALAFVPNPENKETVNHDDGNKLNNVSTNLTWMTYAENDQHALAMGLKNTYRPCKKLTAPLF